MTTTQINPVDPGTVPRTLLPEIQSDAPEAIVARRLLAQNERLETSIRDRQSDLDLIWQDQMDCLARYVAVSGLQNALRRELEKNREEIDALIQQLRDGQKIGAALQHGARAARRPLRGER